jgi:tetratricopeptide (TPR) repeat protein
MKNFIRYLLLFIPIVTFGQVEQIKEAINQKQFDKALELIKNSKKEISLIYFYKAQCEYEKGLYDFSINSATQGLNLDTEKDTLYKDLLLLRTLSYIKAEKMELAIIDNESLGKTLPNNIDYLLNLSYLYGETRKLEASLRILKKAYTIDSLNVYIINNLAYYYSDFQDYNSVISYATKGLKLTVDSVWTGTLLNNLGFAQSKVISTERGLQTITQSINYFPNNPYSYFNIGLIYIDINEINKACSNFKKAKKLGGKNLANRFIEQYCK